MVELFGELSPVLLLLLVMGLVEFAKKFGLKGNAVIALSMGLGVVFGLLYQIATLGAPPGFSGWFVYVVFGLIFGLAASGLWDLGKRFATPTTIVKGIPEVSFEVEPPSSERIQEIAKRIAAERDAKERGANYSYVSDDDLPVG